MPIRRLMLAAVVAGTLAVAGCSGGGASDDASVSPPAFGPPPSGTGEADDELVIGTLLPETGNLAYLGPPSTAGVKLAVREINEAGGVLQKPVQVVEADSGDSANNVAPGSVDQLFDAKADAIVGSASSSVTLTVLDKVTSAGVMLVSPAATAVELSAADDHGLFFRTVPADALQGVVLAGRIADDGNSKVAILARDDAYGASLAEAVERNVVANGGEVGAKVTYPPDSAVFTDQVRQIAAAQPDAIVVASFDEFAEIVPELTKAGVGPKQKKIYVVAGGVLDSYSLPRGALQGVVGPRPGARSSADFRARLKAVDPQLTDFSFAPEAYDATVLTALAASKTQSDAGQQIAQQMVAMSKDGEKCTSFGACRQLLDAGKDIDYDGVSGRLGMDDTGGLAEASIALYEYAADNRTSFVSSVRVSER